MKVTIEIQVNPGVGAVAKGVAQRLGEAALRQVGSGQTKGTVTETNGSATFKVEPPAPASKP